jgi:hypothetical protein
MQGSSAMTLPPIQLALLFFFFIEYVVCVVNWWFFVEFETALFGSTVVDVHLAFNIIGCIAFYLIASPFLFMPYHFKDQMEYKVRRNSTVFALGISFLLHDMPIWFIEFWIVWNFGWIHVIQGVSIILVSIAFAIGFFAVWLGFAWKMSKFLQTHFSGSSFAVAVAGGGGPMQGDLNPRTI